MGIAITEAHLELASTARRFLDRHCPPPVVRRALEAEEEQRPEFWSELTGLGWLGLHIPAELGGQGFGLAELAVVVEELGRAGAPGPFLPTALAAGAIARGGGGRLHQDVLPGLISGMEIGGVAFPGTTSLEGETLGADGTLTVTGTSRPVPAGGLADWFVLPVTGPAGERWCVIPAGEVTVAPIDSLDPTRRSAAVTADAVVVPPARQLSIDRQAVGHMVATLVAAECAGGAAWCLDTASEYAKVRQQFGRPIGQFQAVKHKCAGMLVATEQIRAVAWDAAQALDSGNAGTRGEAGDRPAAEEAGEADEGHATGQDDSALAASVAAAIAPDAFFETAKDCIQVLGGIGFTWEHDAHLYLRRATSLRQLLGGPSPAREELATLALRGARRRIEIDLPAGAEALRAEIRSLAEAVAARPESERRAALVDDGLFVPHWPEPWGRSAGPVEQLVIDEELRRAGLKRPHLAVGAWAAPTIATHGTPDQQERWVRPTLLGTISWCQLFSEPGAGSDLAALSTKALRVEGGWQIDGQKVWTSLAQEADWGICLARTEPSAPKHLGITYFVVDMRSPGIEIRPLRELTGMAMFNEVFLTSVFVPDDGVIGEPGSGWQLARTTLANERVAMGSGASFGGGMESVISLVQRLDPGAFGPVERDHFGALVAEARSVALLGLRSTQRSLSGAAPGPEASVRKLLSAEHDQRAQEFGLSLLGAEGATTEGPAGQWTFGFLANRCLTIAGGTSEVQRNVIGERLLGLPRDPEPAAPATQART